MPRASKAASPSGETYSLRPQISAGSARSLLLTILGEFVYPIQEPVSTSALIYVLKGVGIEEKSARQAIARGAAAGWITSEKRGREVFWQLTPVGRQLIQEGAVRVSFLNSTSTSWNGQWLTLIITVPESRREVRRKLYGRLSWAGFGNLTPGLWISPHPERVEEARRAVEELGLSDSTVSFIGTCAGIGLSDKELLERAWNLGAIVAHYEEVLLKFKDLQPQERLQLAKQLGATHTLRGGEEVVTKVRELSAGRGADVVLEIVGRQETVRDAIRMTRRGGQTILVVRLVTKYKLIYQPLPEWF